VGGGSFVAFPVLIFLGLSPIEANATATLAIFPGTFATLFTYRNELLLHKEKLPFYISLSTIGGAVGALILLNISNVTFSSIVPYLLLVATLLFTFRARLIRLINKFTKKSGGARGGGAYHAFMVFLFIAISIYGGFFGAGMGILMLALLSLMGMHNIHEMNALRACTGLFANIIAIILFGMSGIIMWKDAAIMALGCIAGGFLELVMHYACLKHGAVTLL